MSNKVQRNFIVGDNWLYYKIYTGSKTSDTILTDIIKPISEQLLRDNIIDRWFFIRYADPKHHLRVRFNCNKPENIGIIINSLYPFFKEFINYDLIWKIQMDTYQREIERYGENTMTLAEDIFYHDSKMIVNFISMIEGDEGDELRWFFAIKAIDSHINSYKYTDEEKLQLLNRLKTDFGNEFGMSRPLKKQLDKKYRKERKKIEVFMNLKAEDNSDYTPVLKVLKIKEESIAQRSVKNILRYKKEGYLQVDLNGFIGSQLHMLINRLFISKNRIQEMVCYDFLYRYHKSMIARKKTQRKNIQE